MTTQEAWNEASERAPVRRTTLSELYLKEDWWAIWLGLGIVVIAVVLFGNNSTFLKSLAVNPEA